MGHSKILLKQDGILCLESYCTVIAVMSVCQLLSHSAKQIYLGGTPPIMPLWGGGQYVGVLNLHWLSVSEFTFTVCIRIYMTLVFWTSDIFGNPVPFWHLLLSPGVPPYIKAPHWEHGSVFGGAPLGYIRFDPPLKSIHIYLRLLDTYASKIAKISIF